jgi:hypothetical protein
MKRLKFLAELAIEPDGTVNFKVSDYTQGVKPIATSSEVSLHKALEAVEHAIEARAAEHNPAPAPSEPSEDESNPS